MNYEPLSKLYYKFPKVHEDVYLKRFNAPMTKHFEFSIRQYNRQNEYPAFLCYTEEFMLLVEKIYRKHERLLEILEVISPLVIEQFILLSVVDEVRATSDIEGVHSTRREIEDVVKGTTHSTRAFQALSANTRHCLTRRKFVLRLAKTFAHFTMSLYTAKLPQRSRITNWTAICSEEA